MLSDSNHYQKMLYWLSASTVKLWDLYKFKTFILVKFPLNKVINNALYDGCHLDRNDEGKMNNMKESIEKRLKDYACVVLNKSPKPLVKE